VASVRNRSRTVAIEVCLSFNLVVVFDFNVFLFPTSKAQFLSNVPMNRQKRSELFTPFLNFFCCVDGDRFNEEDGDGERDGDEVGDGNGEEDGDALWDVYGISGGESCGVADLTAEKVFPLYFISCENHNTYGSKINVLLIPTVIYRM
jgi:hypothetical protein